MKRGFMNKINKFTSLLLATVLILCSFEAVLTKAYAAYEAVTEDVLTDEAASEEINENYNIPMPQPEPGYETERQEEIYYDPEAEAENVAEEYVFEDDATDAEVSTYSLQDEVSLYSAAYTLSAEEIAEYDTKDRYEINCVDDWLRVEALSKEVGNFEGKSVDVQSPTDNLLAKYNLSGTGFTGLGSASMPFCGTLKTNMFGVSVNADCPLIAYMSSKATIEQFVLGMSGGNAGIAGTLVFEGDEDSVMLLKGITVTGYLEDTVSEGVGGLFGTVINNTEHKFTIDAATVSQSSADNWGGINMVFYEHNGKEAIYGTNTGTFIGKIVGNVTFTVNKDFHITVPSIYGTESTGSVVGRMEYAPEALSEAMENSQLSEVVGYAANPDKYPMLHFKEWASFSIDNIRGTGYNGGIVGYTDHAKIYNDTAEAVLEISNSNISGGKAVGGFIGSAAYTTIDGTGMGEIKVNNSTFECSIAQYVNGGVNEGVVGGFIGIYGDGNNLFNGIKITVNDNVFSTITNTESKIERYMGGLIGKYDSADDIVITPESEPVSIFNIDFKLRANSTHCGGFISYVPKTSGSLYIDTKLSISNVRVYVPTGTTNNYVTVTSCGGLVSDICSDNLTVKNITVSGFSATVGRYLGSIAGRVLGENSVFENLNIDGMSVSDNMDGVSQTTYYTNKSNYGLGAIAGYHKRNAEIKSINVTGMYLSPYIYYSLNDEIASTQVGTGGLIGIAGDIDIAYSIMNVSDISISGSFDLRYYSSTRYYSAGLIGFVYPKTAISLDGNVDLSGITSYKSGMMKYRGKIIGYQREALIYMEPTCSVTYNEDVFAKIDEVSCYGGIYRNETFWDNAVVDETSSSAAGGTLLIEQTPDTESGIIINGSVETYDGGWGLKTMGDYMRFSIVNNTIGYYGLECFDNADEYSKIAGGTFTARNDIDLSARYMGILTLNRNDWCDYSSQYYHYAQYHFRGVFKGMDGEDTTITLPGVEVYAQSNVGGLFSVVNGAEFRNLCIKGKVETCQLYSGYGNLNGAGALASVLHNSVTVEDVIIEDLTINTYIGEANMSAGSLFGNCRYYTRTGTEAIENYDYITKSVNQYGTITPTYEWNSSIKNVTVKNSVINAKNTNNNNNAYIGGIAGRWYYESYGYSSQTVDFDNVNLINLDINHEYANEGRIGGLVSYTQSLEDHKLTFNLNDVKIDGMDITTASNGYTGGFWGYSWSHTDINLTYKKNTDKVVVDNSNLIVKANNAYTRFGGMIYSYQRSTLDLTEGIVIRNTNISAPKSTQNQCSFFISQATTLLMVLRDYRLINTSVEFGGTQFDEVAGVTKNTDELNPLYNMGIVSLSDSENPFCLKEEGFHVYEYQSDYSKCPNLAKPYYNAYTRYYYNLDEVAKKVAKEAPIKLTTISYDDRDREAYDIKTPEQLMIWHIMMTIYYYHYSTSYESECSRMMRYFADCFDIPNIENIYTGTLREKQLKITGKLDMSGLSFYPSAIFANNNYNAVGNERMIVGADFNSKDAGKGNNGVIFDYDTINQNTDRCLADDKNCVVLRSSCTTGSYYGASQHSQLHCGLFGFNTSVNEINDISLGGSIGAVQYNAATFYSGAAFCGLLENKSVEMRIKNITLDGLYVVNPKENYDAGKNTGDLENWKNYYGMLLGGWINNSILLFFDTIETTGYEEFVEKYPNKKAASALIGRVGEPNVVSFKKFEFANMSIADAEETSVLTQNGTTLEKIHATAEDQIMAYASYVYSYQYSNAEQGFYNFDDVCYFYGNGQYKPKSRERYYITLGKELGNEAGVTKTEYYNTTSKVGTPSHDTVKGADNPDYIDFNESDADYWLDFSNLNYKPYIYNYAERYINVNYKSGNLLEGCGTYEDPYIISNERQLYSLYCYLAAGGLRYTNNYDNDVYDSTPYSNDAKRYPQYNNGFKTKLNEWKVNIPGTDDHMCKGDHTALTYNYEENPVSGFKDDLVTPTSTTRKWDLNSPITVNLLRNAYYKITADIDMSEYDDFYGLCHFDPKIENGQNSSSYFPFTGVIIGEKADGSAPVIKMPNFKKFAGTNANMLDYTRSYGFVASAKGCVLKNLTIKYPEDGYAKLGYYYNSFGSYFFGGAIGAIWGGDNIIDNVRTEGSVMVNQNRLSASDTNRNYMGGLVGVCYGGGLILRNLSTDDFSDFDFRLTSNTSAVQAECIPDKSYTAELNTLGADYDYINGIVGRVMDSYVLVESVDEPRNPTDANGIEQKKLDASGPVITFEEYDETDPKKLHAQKGYNLINGAYLEDAGKIKITRNGYDFDCEISNAKQLFAYAQTMNSGGFFTACGSGVDSANTYGNAMWHSRSNLTHVYHCASSSISSYDPVNSYDVYSRCRKAKYDHVGKCDVSDENSAVNDDYKYAKKYDNLLTSEYFRTNAKDFDANSYKNYLGYNYMVSKYFDFYEGNKQDEFWIMRRSGIYKNNSDSYNNRMHNLFNAYKGYDDVSYQGTTNVRLVTGTYDMSVFKQAFRGIGSMFDMSQAVYYTNGNTHNGNFDGENSTVIMGLNAESGTNLAGLFTRLVPGFNNSNTIWDSSKRIYLEGAPIREIKDLNITGFVNNIYTTYRQAGSRAGLLCGYVNSGRYKFSNIHVNNAEAGAYSHAGGIIGEFDSSTQLLMENCTAEKVSFTNEPKGANNRTAANMGGLFGILRTANTGSNANYAYITDCSVSDIAFEARSTECRMGGLAGDSYYLYYMNLYNFSADKIFFNVVSNRSLCGGLIGRVWQGSDCDVKNLTINDMRVENTEVDSILYIGGAFGYIDYQTNFSMENTCISKIRVSTGTTRKEYSNNCFYSSSGGYLGGVCGYMNRTSLHMDGIYIDDIKMEESRMTESNREERNGVLNRITLTATQKLKYSGGIAGYIYESDSSETNLRIVSLDEDRITATPTPMPTVRPRYKDGEKCYEIPAAPETEKEERNYIKNCELLAQYTGGVAGYVNKTNMYGNNTQNKTDWLIEDLDITENKIVSHYAYKNSYASGPYKYTDSYYTRAAGGMFGYMERFQRGDLYSNNVTVEHNVIGSDQNMASRSYCGGLYGYISEGENNYADRSGYSNYFYNATLKNNYIGPLDLIKNEEQYYPTTLTAQNTYDFLKKLCDAYNDIRTMSIDELGALTRLYTDGEMVSSDSWDYSLTESGSGEWYAQDNLYKYAKNVGMFIGYNSQTATTNKRFHIFIVAPKIIYDNTLYEYEVPGGVSITMASARRPAVDVGSKDTLSAGDDMYAYRDYTHIVYNDANKPVEYGEWNKNVADYVVPEGLGYDDNHDYLFAQLRNIYDDYKAQIQDGYINTAEYDKTTHTYRLKDNYGQVENGYTMDEVYDYVYYGYERDTDGNPVSASPDYLSPYKDKNNKIIPMLVYKAQYGTPDMLMNTIVNILTNNGGAYNTNVGYFNANTVSILNVESWKMELEDGVASPVYESDGVTHKQGGFSVNYKDSLPKPPPTSTAAPKPQVRNFELAHTSYDAQKDDTNGTFTVLHITYGWNPSSMTIDGKTISCGSVMTLDIPVYVSKLLEVQINMKTLDGVQLSESNMAANGTESGVVVLKTTNTVMAEYVYDYPRTMYDEVYLKKKLTFEVSPGNIYLHKNTKLTLIDMTDHDKAYYYYVDKTVANPQIPFEDFVDAYGNNYKTRDVSNLDDYPKLGTETSPYTDLRGQTWGGNEEDENFINDYGIGVERFLIIIDKSATEIDANDQTGYTYHSIHVRVDEDATDPKLMERIRYDGKNYKETELNTPTDEYPNPDWYDEEVNGYKAYNYVTIREIDDVKISLPSGVTDKFGSLPDEKIGIGAGNGLKSSVHYTITASHNYWNESGKAATDQYLDFVISIQCDNKYVTLPVGTKYSFNGTTWYTIGRGQDYEYGKKQIYYYADRAKKDIENGGSGAGYQEVINKLGGNSSGTLDIYFDFRDCSETAFSDGNYLIRVDAYKSTNREFPVSGDYQDSWFSDVYSVYNSSNIGFALQEDDLLYRGINRYLPKVSDNGVIDYKAQLDFRKYLDEETGEIKDVVTNQYYTIGFKIMKKRSDGVYTEYEDKDNRFKFYYDKAELADGINFGSYDGVVDSSDPMAYGYDADKNMDCGGVTYKFTAEQLNGSSSIKGVAELAFRLVYDTNDLTSEDFSNYKFIAYLYLSEENVSGKLLPEGSSEVLTKEQAQSIANMTADPLSDYLIFTLARLKTD